MNTSFNLKGEPIVKTPAKALPRSAGAAWTCSSSATASSRSGHREGRSREAREHIQSRTGIVGELLQFFWSESGWWLTPMLLLLLLVGGLIVFAQSSAIAPFIYTLF